MAIDASNKGLVESAADKKVFDKAEQNKFLFYVQSILSDWRLYVLLLPMVI